MVSNWLLMLKSNKFNRIFFLYTKSSQIFFYRIYNVVWFLIWFCSPINIILTIGLIWRNDKSCPLITFYRNESMQHFFYFPIQLSELKIKGAYRSNNFHLSHLNSFGSLLESFLKLPTSKNWIFFSISTLPTFNL